MKEITTSVNKPPKFCIFGRPGIGKSRLAASFPRPFFLRCEDRHDHLSVKSHEGILDTYDKILDALDWLISSPHNYKTVVFDTVDSAEKSVHGVVCQQAGVTDILHPKALPFYSGFVKAAEIWDAQILSRLRRLNEERKMLPLLISHVQTKMEPHPQYGEYQKFTLGCDKRVAAKIYKWCDIVGFLDWHTINRTQEGDDRVVLASTNERVLRLQPKFYWETKESYNLPDDIKIPEDKGSELNGWKPIQAALKAGIGKAAPIEPAKKPPPVPTEAEIQQAREDEEGELEEPEKYEGK